MGSPGVGMKGSKGRWLCRYGGQCDAVKRAWSLGPNPPRLTFHLCFFIPVWSLICNFTFLSLNLRFQVPWPQKEMGLLQRLNKYHMQTPGIQYAFTWDSFFSCAQFSSVHEEMTLFHHIAHFTQPSLTWLPFQILGLKLLKEAYSPTFPPPMAGA